jgi:alpha-1,2-mannosyltransferase
MRTSADRFASEVFGLVGGLKTGNFLTRERMQLVAAVVIAFTVLTLGFLAATATGSVDILRRPLGTDFSSFYAAGRLVLEGTPTAPYTPAAQHAQQQVLFGADTPFYAWQYPPLFLAIAAPLALLPYPLALFVWLGETFALYLWMLAGIIKAWLPSDGAVAATLHRSWWLLALGFPAVFINFGNGQNGFLSATLVGGALVTLDRRPVVAGIFFGLLAYKPQLGVMIPVVLLATNRWRSFLAASITVMLLGLSTLAVFGLDVWQVFLHSTSFTRRALLEGGGPGWEKIQSIFAWVRLWGGPTSLAYFVQGAVAVAVAIALIWLWRGPARYPVKAAALAIGGLLAAPFSIDYDMTVLALAIAFLALDGLEHGFAPYEKSVLAALWLVPLVARSAGMIYLPLGAMTMAGAFTGIIVWSAAGRTTPHAEYLPDSVDPANGSIQ